MNTEESKINDTENPQSERLVGNVITQESMDISEDGDYTSDEKMPAREYNGLRAAVDVGIPSNSELRGISINPLSSGYMVKVGCQSVAVESTEKLIDMLNKYLTDPDDFERKWYSNNVINRLDNIK